jgi:hypothetical protein
LQLAGHAVIVLFVGQEQEIGDIVLLFVQFVPGIHPLPQFGDFAHHFLRSFVVIPEIGQMGFGFEVGYGL